MMTTSSTDESDNQNEAIIIQQQDNSDYVEDSVIFSCEELCRKARALWLQQPQSDLPIATATVVPTNPPPIDVTVEALYRLVWKRHDDEQSPQNSEPSCKKAKRMCSLDYCSEFRKVAGEKLALILLQSQRSMEADVILRKLGYVCRLTRCVLDYDDDNMKALPLPSVVDPNKRIPCCIYDHVLTPFELETLQDVFTDPNSTYWTDHKYSVEPPSPYFSYILDIHDNKHLSTTDTSIDNNDNDGMLYGLIRKLQNLLQPHFPSITDAKFIELWAHNRPACTGHQFHFDSDNEGCTSIIRNPIVTCVLYLNNNAEEAAIVGGPSIVTTQRLVSRTLAEAGWACPPQLGRILALDGKVLHGVIPGKLSALSSSNPLGNNNQDGPPHGGRRVTVMLAFWRRIRVRDQPGAAACAWPHSVAPNSWANQLLVTSVDANDKRKKECSKTMAKKVPLERAPVPLECIYEIVDPQVASMNTKTGERTTPLKPWNRKMGFPDYDQIFQGF